MPAETSPSYVRVSRLGWCVIGAVGLLPWVIVVSLLQTANTGKPVLHPVTTSAPKTPVVTQHTAGPWGHLTSSRILIEPPEDFIPPNFTAPQPIRWMLPGYTPQMLDVLWRDAGLDERVRTALSAAARQIGTAPGIVVEPPAELVLALAPAARAKIYGKLAVFPENGLQRDPFRSRADAVDDWFADESLPPTIVALTRQLLYPREGNMLFSDHDLVLPHLASINDRVRYIKVLSRKSALLVQLHVAHGEDVEPLANYWGRGRRSKDVGPLLESLAHEPGGGAIDIVHLLPPFARLLLYTYPTPSNRATDAAHDCHWTSFNFTRGQPDERFANLEFVQQTLLDEYYQVGDAPAMGDIILLVQDGHGVHSCVHVAGDIVFTKNGSAFSVPWILARLDNVVTFYSLAGPLEIRRYRAR